LINSPHAARTRRRVQVVLAWAATIVWAGVIFQFSTEAFSSSYTAWVLELVLRVVHLHLSSVAFNTLHFLIRKAAHLTEYGIFGLLLYHSFNVNHPGVWSPRKALWAVIVAGLYSFTDEYHQLFVHGRTSSLVDCGIDTTGAALAALGVYGNLRLFHANHKNATAASESPQEAKKGVAGE
jgi:VanZ family protein